MKDWTGDKNSVYKTLGASNHTDKEIQTDCGMVSVCLADFLNQLI